MRPSQQSDVSGGGELSVLRARSCREGVKAEHTTAPHQTLLLLFFQQQMSLCEYVHTETLPHLTTRATLFSLLCERHGVSVAQCAAKTDEVIVTDVCLCVLCLLCCTQLDAWWSMVITMVRRHLMRPQSRDRVRWPSIMGTGVLYLLLLSSCLGQDTEGKVSLSCSSLILSVFLSFLLSYNSQPIQLFSARHQHHKTSGTDSCGVSQHLFDSLLICAMSVNGWRWIEDYFYNHSTMRVS